MESEKSTRDWARVRYYIPENACEMEHKIQKYLDEQGIYSVDLKNMLENGSRNTFA